MLKRYIPMLLAVPMIALAVAGCGGSDDPAPTPPAAEQPAEPEALTKDQLIAQGDRICAEVNAAVGTIDGSTTIAESDKAGQKADLYDGLADRLEDLGTPSDGDAPTAVIAALRGEPTSDATAGTEAETGAESAAGSDPAAFQEAAAAYGFSDCAEAPSAPTSTGTESDGSVGAEGTDGTDSSGGESTYTEPAPAAPETQTAPPADTGGVNPNAGTGGDGGTDGGSGNSSGGNSGGIGPG